MKNYTKPVSIGKLLTKKSESELLKNLMSRMDGALAVYDAGGKKIAGKAGPDDTRFPVRLDGETIGWVSGGKSAPVIAALLSRLAGKERDIKCLGEETLDKYKEINLFYSINEKIALCIEPAGVAEIIIREARKMIKSDNVSVMLMNNDTGVLEVLSASGREFNPKAVLKPRYGIAGSVFSKGRAEIVNDADADKRFVKGANKVSSIICAPLKINERAIGVMNISAEKPYHYNAADLKLLTTLASVAASAIEITRLYAAEKRRAEDLSEKNKGLQAEQETLARENINLKQNLRKRYSTARILCVSPAMKEILGKVEKIADTPVNVLITGETGTGKDLIAKAIHYNSSRAGKPFVAVNCSAIPETIFESEMFGIEKGVATGVDKRIGKIEHADGGTLFLDEIGDMSLSNQVKMLRVIEGQEVERVGGREPVPVNIRLVAATNKDLRKEIEKGAFREDLFYRLNVVNLRLPPLRERTDDIPILLNHFLEECSRRFGRPRMRLASDIVKALTGYHWPGNVRELENEIEKAVALSTADTITVHDISETVRKQRKTASGESGALTIDESEKILVQKALDDAGGNKSKTAITLGISREGLRKKMKRYGFQ
ncbi:MAG: hypothetical protein A2X55_09535 [Nitrospirae bacterium GWB2_47_37]|nr:MAG: hypothetical protein A2Z82_10070 [Nitrospirae bacterium GWA2_46_11]OGW23203.1 MAG: hypothetical protein A2X55_09535 [Nitrospirae bacterium GWB2_47_37]HAK87754.1 hypothetical protein [Nitrospiraceae bacterium]